MRTIILGLSIFFALATNANAVVITENRGGFVPVFAHEIERLIQRGETFEVDGMCASSCTLILQAPQAKICVTERAAFGFHTAYRRALFGSRITDVGTSQYIIYKYPAAVQEWINKRGGLTAEMIWLEGKELARMFKPCSGTLAAIH